ncbi:glycosyltransferase family 4 protein [Paenibacillus glacialis]|uniref:Glycosyltransferase n=1 Tax=Paenibacillus glacialis TaxID=494026 RepID=A0A168NYG3_9BACL|nr:glycosyltransferase family 4 protein [Paenibacillus glacialis]OAB46220.1 glycosyltransferase [Paenibacillus glacialis]
MNILHIANHVKQCGNGIVNVMIDLACEQAKLGHNVAVASEGGGYIELLLKNNIQHYKLDQTRKPAQMMQAFFNFRKMVKQFKPDIIHAHMMTGALLSRYLKGFQKYKIVTHVHNEFQKSADFMKVGDSVIAVSQAVAISMVSRGVQENKLHIVLNGTIGSSRKGDTGGVCLKGLSIVTVAGLYERKGIFDLIEAFEIVVAKYPEANLYVLGEGPDRSKFELQANQSIGKDNIHFLGYQSNPHNYMEAADVFVLASHKESFGLVLIEAREAGCAIVATDIDGIPEALDFGESGMLVPPKSPERLAESIISMLQDSEMSNKYRKRALQGLEYYSVERVARDTLKIYEGLLIS